MRLAQSFGVDQTRAQEIIDQVCETVEQSIKDGRIDAIGFDVYASTHDSADILRPMSEVKELMSERINSISPRIAQRSAPTPPTLGR